MDKRREFSSFRDNSGFIFYKDQEVYRAVNKVYQTQFDTFINSGLYKALTKKEHHVLHEEVNAASFASPSQQLGEEIYKILKIEKIPFVSYPYEWCFQQLKDAALLTLTIQLLALEHGLTLKDASAFNVQFRNGKPIFIDTLSFEHYEEGKPWVAYRQFCTHFLAPLAVMAKCSPELRRINELFIDGMPLSLASKLLPFKTKFSPFFLTHIHYHSKLEVKYSNDQLASKKIQLTLSKNKLIAIINHLISGINSLELNITESEWGNYYQEFSYSDESIEAKKKLVREWSKIAAPVHTWDLGCNTGLFSNIVAEISEQVTSFDIDQLAIEKFYRSEKQKDSSKILPLVLDLSNPTPAIGWANKERKAFTERGPADLILALALIHHLALGNNVPLEKIAELFSSLTRWLIVEFVPKEDPQSQRLLVTKEDIFSDYNKNSFENIFQKFFSIEKSQLIKGTARTLYLLKKK